MVNSINWRWTSTSLFILHFERVYRCINGVQGSMANSLQQMFENEWSEWRARVVKLPLTKFYLLFCLRWVWFVAANRLIVNRTMSHNLGLWRQNCQERKKDRKRAGSGVLRYFQFCVLSCGDVTAKTTVTSLNAYYAFVLTSEWMAVRIQ